MLPNKSHLNFPLQALGDEDVQYIETVSANKENSNSPAPVTLGKFGEKLTDYLVDERGRAVSLADRAEGTPKYYVLYYSASWCPPCRQFTPELVRWYSRAKSKYPIETILIPSDKSEEDMLSYMSKYRMRFPGLKFDSKSQKWVPRNQGGGIPALLLVDSDGNRLLSSQDVPRADFLKEVEKYIKAN